MYAQALMDCGVTHVNPEHPLHPSITYERALRRATLPDMKAIARQIMRSRREQDR